MKLIERKDLLEQLKAKLRKEQSELAAIQRKTTWIWTNSQERKTVEYYE